MSEANSITFTLFQWNTLNRKLADKNAFPMVDIKHLQWYHRHSLIKKIIEENKSDIICLEEVGNNYDLDFKKKIFEKCTIKYDLIFELRPSKSMGNLIGVNKDLFSIESHENIILKNSEGKSSGQNMISAVINNKKTNDKFIIIVVHLKSNINNENIRLGQIEHLMKCIEDKYLRKYPIFILGDFNAEPNYSCIIKFLENKNINAKSLFNPKKLEYTTYNIKEILYKRILDYIFFISKNKGEEDKELKKINSEKAQPIINEKIGLPNDIYPSDHLFLRAQVQLIFN
jgi:mRNA deadenylase 3'-5' endonuclease subunit Ccr4